MKKTYIIPEMTAVYTAQTLLQSASPASSPNVGVNRNAQAIDAGSVEVKDNSQNYDVWDDDWNK